MSLEFKYVELTFQKDEKQIKEHIKNTVTFKYILEKYNQTEKLKSIIIDTQYGYNDSAKLSGKNNFLRISDITDGKVDWNSVPFCDCKNEETYLLKTDDILIARTGGTTGKSFLIKNPPNHAIYAGYLIRIRAKENVNPQYINLFLNSYVYWTQITSLNKGQFRPKVNATSLKNLILPFCERGIQDELVKLSKGVILNGYEELNLRIQDTLEKYNKSKLLSSEINKQKQLITQLKQAILQEAIEGKLTVDWRKENPDVEPASELLKRMKTEKQQLIKEKKIKKEKPLPPILKKDIPFKLPEGWLWSRLGDAILYSDAGKSPNCEKRPALKNEWGVLTTTSIQKGQFLGESNKVLPMGFKINTSHRVELNDILITRAGPITRTGISCKVDNLSSNLILSDKTIRLKHSNKLLSPDFIVNSINSNLIRELLVPKMTGMAESQVNISQGNIKLTPIPIAPLKEQLEIVRKVKSLMQKINVLENEINQSEKNAQTLMQAVLKEAFESKN